MPQLKSGRHVTLSVSPYLNALTSGPDESKYFAVVALRLNVSTLGALRDHLVVGYFVEGEGVPPNAHSYNSGYCVADILEGRSNWSSDEVDEFRVFLIEDLNFGPWLQAQFDEINQTIQDNPVWGTELMESDLASNNIDVPMIKHAIIYKSAMEPNAMAQLRAVKTPIEHDARLLMNNIVSQPSPFESLAAICKFIAVSRINPDFYAKHQHNIEFASTFSRVLASNYPALDSAFRASLPLSLSDGARPIQQALLSLSLSDEKLEWLDRQMTEVMRMLIPVVRDSDLPAWLSDCKWAIEGAFDESAAT